MTAVTPTDRPMSVRNRCVIEVFGGVCLLSRCFWGFSVGVGPFVIGHRIRSLPFFLDDFLKMHMLAKKYYNIPYYNGSDDDAYFHQDRTFGGILISLSRPVEGPVSPQWRSSPSSNLVWNSQLYKSYQSCFLKMIENLSRSCITSTKSVWIYTYF